MVGDVSRGDESALRGRRARGRTLLVVYPEGQLLRKCVERYEGDVVLFVGEGRGGVNASSDEARSMSHWSPYDRVGAVHAVS